MEFYQRVLLGVCCLILVAVAVRLFSAPLRLALKFALNTFLGFAGLLLLNLTGAYTGITLGVNLFNAVVIGFLGLPGFALLLLIKWFFRT